MQKQEPLQYPPGVFDILRGDDDARIARILSLSKTLPSVSGVTWIAHHEHWFTTAGLDLKSSFSISNIKAKYVADLTNLDQIATELANPSLYTFQLYAKGVLSPSDWLSGAPSYNVPAFYFEQDQPPVPDRAMRPLFSTPVGLPTKLSEVAWVTLDNTVTNYFAGLPVGTSILLNAKPLASIPTNGWYYKS